jgi:hypothetical protein
LWAAVRFAKLLFPTTIRQRVQMSRALRRARVEHLATDVRQPVAILTSRFDCAIK